MIGGANNNGGGNPLAALAQRLLEKRFKVKGGETKPVGDMIKAGVAEIVEKLTSALPLAPGAFRRAFVAQAPARPEPRVVNIQFPPGQSVEDKSSPWRFTFDANDVHPMNYGFRSSTSAEDMAGIGGSGLFESSRDAGEKAAVLALLKSLGLAAEAMAKKDPASPSDVASDAKTLAESGDVPKAQATLLKRAGELLGDIGKAKIDDVEAVKKAVANLQRVSARIDTSVDEQIGKLVDDNWTTAPSEAVQERIATKMFAQTQVKELVDAIAGVLDGYGTVLTQVQRTQELMTKTAINQIK